MLRASTRVSETTKFSTPPSTNMYVTKKFSEVLEAASNVIVRVQNPLSIPPIVVVTVVSVDNDHDLSKEEHSKVDDNIP